MAPSRTFLTFLTILLSEIYHAKSRSNVVTPSCPPEKKVCKFHFDIKYNMTMMAWAVNEMGQPDSMVPVVMNEKDGNLFKVKKDCSGKELLSEDERQSFLGGDGNYKRIISINQQLPGPAIVVHQGQVVSVVVTNHMENQVMTLHWHGIDQNGTPWMDGAGGVSQCPIQPRQSFQYKFKADVAGTYWYHGHLGSQRTMGMAGPLIIMDRSKKDENDRRGKDILPDFEKEFYLMLTDWFKKSTEEEEVLPTIWNHEGSNFTDSTCPGLTSMISIEFYSGLINGRGQLYHPETGEPTHPNIPIEVFTVKLGSHYRFRIINSARFHTFILSIDNHTMSVIASDGGDITSAKATHLIISSGETYDIHAHADDPLKTGKYWIRAETTHVAGVRLGGHVKAILQYEHQSKEGKPMSKPHTCASTKKCIYQNCVNRSYPEEMNIECNPITALNQPSPEPTLMPSDGSGFTEYILALEMGPSTYPVMINGKRYVHPVRPSQVYPDDPQNVPCGEECLTTGCKCTHQISLPLNHVIQLTFFAFLPKQVGWTTHHPMHIHGHKFQVIKVGWPGPSDNEDIDCSDTPGWCHSPRWTNTSWKNGHLPGIVSQGAVWKNDVIVPAGGYVTIRFKADNPGYWFGHCHMEPHYELGMAFIMKAGEVSDMPPLPKGFPMCGDFDWTSEEFLDKIRAPRVRGKAENVCQESGHSHFVTTAVLGTIMSALLLLLLTVASMSFAKSRNSRSQEQVLLNDRSGSHSEATPLMNSH